MKRIAALAIFTVAGLATAIVVIWIAMAFDRNPGCGMDCPGPYVGPALLSGLVVLVAFPILGFVCTRGNRLTNSRVLKMLGWLVAMTLAAATGHYVFQLHMHYLSAVAANPVTPDFDFMHMVIAKRSVQAYTVEGARINSPTATIKAWERCALDGAGCDKKPQYAHMRCKQGVLYVREKDWPAFALIREEDLIGSSPMKSMNLCAPNNVLDIESD